MCLYLYTIETLCWTLIRYASGLPAFFTRQSCLCHSLEKEYSPGLSTKVNTFHSWDDRIFVVMCVDDSMPLDACVQVYPSTLSSSFISCDDD